MTIKRAGQRTRRTRGLRRREMQSAMWLVGVVVLDEGRDGAFEMRLVQEQQPIEAVLCECMVRRRLSNSLTLRNRPR